MRIFGINYFVKYRALVFFLSILFPYDINAQSNGIKFEVGSWKDIQRKAKEEGKYVFMDCYTTWCGPCKMMSRNIFPQKKVGDYFNDRFISVAVQMDRTAKDLPDIQNWYTEADSIHSQFQINSYPTYLFFSPDGKAVHRMAGATGNVDEFIAKAADALDPKKQCYTLLGNWKDHRDDSIYLFDALGAAVDIGNKESSIIYDAYIACIKKPFTKENVNLIDKLVNSSKDKVFSLYLNNIDKIDELMGGFYAEETICPIIFREETSDVFGRKDIPIQWKLISKNLKQKYPTISEQLLKRSEALFQSKIKREMTEFMQNNSLDWNKTNKQLKRRFPGYDFDMVFLREKLDYYEHKKISRECIETALIIINRYGTRLGDRKLNDIIWADIFNITDDTRILKVAMKWMKKSVDRSADPQNYDTYANLLYKTGQLKDALIWENKALELAIRTKAKLIDLEDIKGNLNKMKNGERTWEGDSALR